MGSFIRWKDGDRCPSSGDLMFNFVIVMVNSARIVAIMIIVIEKYRETFATHSYFVIRDRRVFVFGEFCSFSFSGF